MYDKFNTCLKKGRSFVLNTKKRPLCLWKCILLLTILWHINVCLKMTLCFLTNRMLKSTYYLTTHPCEWKEGKNLSCVGVGGGALFHVAKL